MAMKSPPGDDSPLRQGAGGDLLDPPRWDRRRRRLWKVFRIVVLGTGVFVTETFYRRKGRSRGGTGAPHHRVARPRGGRAALGCGPSVAPLRLSFGLLEASWENRPLGFDFVQFREYFVTRISETKNSRKQQLALRHLVNRLVPENARIWHKVCIKHVDNINNVAWNIRNYRYVGDVSASPSLVLLVPSR